MLKKLAKSIFIVGVTSSFVSPVSAENQYYAGGGVSFLDYSEDGISDDASLNALYGRLGMNFNENFSGEIRAGFGVGDDSVNVYGYDVDVELDNFFGAYVRGGIPVTESFFPYAVLGYTRGEVTASVPGYSESESESDVSFGVGTDIKVSNNLHFNVEYMNYIDKDGAEIDGFSIGVVTNF